MSAPVPLRQLLGLGAVVLAVHLLLLEHGPGGLDTPAAPTAPPVFTTRSVPPPATAPAATPDPVPPPPPSPATAVPDSPPTAPPEGETEASAPSLPPPVSGVELEQPPLSIASAQPTASSPAKDDAAELQAQVAAAARLRYDLSGNVKGLPYHADAELLWQHDGQHYTTQLEIRAFLLGSRRQTSEGELTPQGLAPRRFADKARNEQAAHFHRDTLRVSFSANTPDAVLQPGAQDKLSVFLQLGALLAGQPQRWPVGSTLHLQVIGAKQAEPWTVHIDGVETLHLPSGELRALKLSRAPRAEFEPRVDVWLAPSLQYLPVRIRLSQANGDVADQQLNRIEWLSPAPR